MGLSEERTELLLLLTEAQPISCHIEPDRLTAVGEVLAPPSMIQLGNEDVVVPLDEEPAPALAKTTDEVEGPADGTLWMALVGTLTSCAVATPPSAVVSRTVVPPSEATLYGTLPGIT